MSEKLAIAKLAINVIAGASVSKVVNDIIRNNTNVETVADSVKVWTGSIVIGSMVADNASNHVNAKFDKAVNWYERRKTQNVTNEYKSDR